MSEDDFIVDYLVERPMEPESGAPLEDWDVTVSTGPVGLAFHPDSYMMVGCACGFMVHAVGREHARAVQRMMSHMRRCPVARRLTDAEYQAEQELRKANTP